MPKKIHSINEEGRIFFVGDKRGEAVTGTQEDCLSYGYHYKNSKCYYKNIDRQRTKRNSKNKITSASNKYRGTTNAVRGNSNTITGSRNIVLGDSNDLFSNDSLAIGRYAYTDNTGEIAIANASEANRSKYAVLHYHGKLDNVLTQELLISNRANNRFYINESYESVYAIEYTASVLEPENNNAWSAYGRTTFKYVNSTLTQVASQVSTQKDSALNSYDLTLSAVSGTPDYIKLLATGVRTEDSYWTVILRVTEIRNA